MMPAVEVITASLEPSEGGISFPCSKRQKTEKTATQGESDSFELPEKEKANDIEQQSRTDFPTPHNNQSSQSENVDNESLTVSKFKEGNGQHNEKNCITVPEKNVEFENELSLFYEELEKIENEAHLLANECVDGSAENKGNTAVDKHGNKTDKECKKIIYVKHKTRRKGDPCTDPSQIPATEHPYDATWSTVMSPSRPQWNQPQPFIGPQGPPLPRLNIPLAYQRYSGLSQGPMPFPHDRRFLSNSYGSGCNSTLFTTTNESRIQVCPINDCAVQSGHQYFCNYGPHQNTEGRPIMLRPGRTNLCHQYQKVEQHSRPGIGHKVLIFMRGPPGSGKSTLSRLLLAQSPNGVVLSTDDYFCRNGVYWFDPSLLGEAHEWNQSRAKKSMDEGRSPIIIDNTNIQAWEMKPYAEMAVERCYSVSFREPETWWKFNVVELEKRNKHQVPREKIIQMMERFEHPISSDIVLNAVEPSRINKVLLDLHPHYNQRKGKGRKKPKVLPPLNKRTRGNAKNKEKHRQHRKVKACQNMMSEIKAESCWLGAFQEHHTTKCEDYLSDEEHNEAENISVTDLVTTLRDSQDSIGAQVEQILHCNVFEDKEQVFSIKENMFISTYERVVKGGFTMADVLTVETCDLHIHLSEDYEDSLYLKNSSPLFGIHWESDQSHCPLVKNYISVIDTAADKANLVVLTQKYCIHISKNAVAGSLQYPPEIESVFNQTSLEYAQGLEEIKTSVLEDDADDYKRKEMANLTLNSNFLTNLLEGEKIASWGCCNGPVSNIYRPYEQRQKTDCKFRQRDASVKNKAEKWLYQETTQQNPLARTTFCHESSSTENISQGNNYPLQLCPEDNSSTAQCETNQFAPSDIVSEKADGMKETKSFCIGEWVNETEETNLMILHDSFYNPPLAKINSRRKPKRFYRLAPTFQISRETAMDSKESRREDLFLTEIKPKNCMSATNIFQSGIASVNLSVQENIGTCHEKLVQTADEGSQFVNRFCETIPFSKIINNKLKKEHSKEASLLKQGLDGSCNVQSLHTLKHETMHNDMLPDPSQETDVSTINPSTTILDNSKTFFTGKPVLKCLPYANSSRSSEVLFSYVDSMKKEGHLMQFDEQFSASFNPCVECELTEKSRKDDDQVFLMFPEKCPFLELQLSLEFALQLVELFGSPGIDPAGQEL
ncbi:uncharacterized protein [Heterodontus francisci]|uniref:uncharacterized protein isoform X2 n=1 Tax=Heterodontus francisci TaxID=7792 RepID=UPI00355BD5FE